MKRMDMRSDRGKYEWRREGEQEKAPEEEAEALRRQLEAVQEECKRLREENTWLKSLLGASPEEIGFSDGHKNPASPTAVHAKSPTLTSDQRLKYELGASYDDLKQRISLFRSLFRGREDVYAVRWESRDGKSGYSPACLREWERPVCEKPKVKCSACKYRQFAPITDKVIRDHLSGRCTIGVYPLLPDETCWFLAIDFDKGSWQEDVAAFLHTCEELSVPVSVERSRSGNGAHVWVFFHSPVPARQARKLGTFLLTRTMERRHQIGMDSYDRLFPNQDTMPKGGFGNLIALPLQYGPSLRGNTLFLDKDFKPYPDQWLYLSTVRRLHSEEMGEILNEATRTGSIMNIRLSLTDENEEDPWTLPPSAKGPAFPGKKSSVRNHIAGPLPERVRVVHSNLLYIEKEGLSPALTNRLIRRAAFQNPEFYKAQAMRLSTFGKPRVISCAEDFPRYIGLPRGCLDDVSELFRTNGISMDLVDRRVSGRPIEVNFRGELRSEQKEAAAAMLAHDIGVLSAGTAFGKTVVGAWLIAARKVNTLVLVHRNHLLHQWREQLANFLSISQESIGEIGAGKRYVTGIIDVAMLQSINRGGVVDDLVADYGQVIVDECQHISAFSFEQVLKQVKAKYVVGLTATPVRRDGHHPIVIMQCGPIRYRTDLRKQAKDMPFDHVVFPRETDFRMEAEEDSTRPKIQDIYKALVNDSRRNDMIVADLVSAVKSGRSPLVLTERTEHLDVIAERLMGLVGNVFVLRGRMGTKQTRLVLEQIAAIPDDQERVIIATGRYIGEGFDDARLDTLFLAMPISWRGTLQQYAGRLHRLNEGKRVVQIYDYVDVHVPILRRMYEKRVKGYKAMGYSVIEDACSIRGLFTKQETENLAQVVEDTCGIRR